MPSGTFSTAATSSTTGTLRVSRLVTSTARTAVPAPSAFLGVPFTPVVRVSAVASRVTAPSPTCARHASVVELPTSTPTTSSIRLSRRAELEVELHLFRPASGLDGLELLEVQQRRLGLPARPGHLVVARRHRLGRLALGVAGGVAPALAEHRGVGQRPLRGQ